MTQPLVWVVWLVPCPSEIPARDPARDTQPPVIVVVMLVVVLALQHDSKVCVFVNVLAVHIRSREHGPLWQLHAPSLCQGPRSTEIAVE